MPAIEIDTELANAQYENQNELENLENQLMVGDHLADDINADINQNQQNMIRIEGEDDHFNDANDSSGKQSGDGQSEENSESENPDGKNEDELQDAFAKAFLKDLNKVGPYSKQMLNYSYPPLLYQRGDDSEEDAYAEEEEEEEESQNSAD